ncbi:hypothetical protein [Epilithonimonas sp.]|uniref:hypothetical protein n=1 Tax=Epilithonimonas sp. TaxID=2894511 RepID=UPI002897DA0C|nr:hypothetical protein [Epilithonimonas sp.]
MKAKKIPQVPEQIKGAFHDTESRKDFIMPEFASWRFDILKNRFFSINHWKDYCGSLSSEFKLYDASGSYVERKPKKGDFIRIDIPGPGDVRAKGYDWVEIVMIDDQAYNDEIERHIMICRPSKEPGSESDRIAHFYSAGSSSTFVISRGPDYIKVGIYGRNEVPNTTKTGILGKIRNFLVSLGGFARLTKIQWKSLADGLLEF